jgi:hypothetical protein
MTSVIFATLGPSGTNHEFVAKKYIDFHRDFHGFHQATLILSDTAMAGAEAVRDGVADYFIVCAVHPDTPNIVGHFFREVFIVDTFISPSLPLAVLTRADVTEPRSLGVLHPATTNYIDTCKWQTVCKITTGSLHTVADGLLRGRYDSGLVYLNYAQRYPDQLRVDQEIGSPDDAWLVLGRKRTYVDPILAWRDSPIATQFVEFARDRARRE